MDFAYSAEQETWRATVRQFLADHCPVSAARALHERRLGHDPQLWRRLGELGMHGIHIAEKWGGQGFTAEELAIVTEELGRVLACTPYLVSTGLAASVLHSTVDGPAAGLLPPVATGERIATLALWEPGPGGWADPVTVTAEPAGGGVALRGQKPAVPFGGDADLLLVSAVSRGSGNLPLLVAVERQASGVQSATVDSLDLTSRLATVTFHDAPGQVLAEGPAARAALQLATAYAGGLQAAELLGGAQACLDAAVSYARQRHQFGRPIGSFQAIKHLLADLLAELELARSATLYAVWTLRTGDPGAARSASLANALAGDTYLLIADAALHVHGGMGFTWEHDAHLYLRRAQAASLLFGDPAQHRERFLHHPPLKETTI